MKLLFLLFLAFNNVINANTNTHESDTGKLITTSKDWDESVLAYIFYGAEFNLQNVNNDNYMIINTFPKGLLINESNIPTNKIEIKKLLKLIDQIESSDNYYNENENFTIGQVIKSETITGVFATSHFKDSEFINYSWIGTVNDHSIIVKIISKSSEIIYDSSDLESIINNLIISEKKVDYPSSDGISSIYNYTFYPDNEFMEIIPNAIDGPYRRMNLSYSENDRISSYLISSQCNDEAIPSELFLGVILDNFGYESTKYSHEVKYKGKPYYFNFGGYSNDKGDFNSVTFVTMESSCQHSLTYITEKSEPILNRFFNFVDNFNPQHQKAEIDFSLASVIDRKKYAQLLSEIGDKYYSLKIYKKSIDFFHAAYNIFQNKTYFYDLLQSHYNVSQYDEGLNLILKHETRINEQTLIIWKAWYLARMNRPKESAEVFADAFKIKFTEDEDFFKYLDQLFLAKEYKNLLSESNYYRKNVSDINLLELKVASALIKSNPKQAKVSIEKFLDNESMANSYQFHLLDYLAEIEAYALIEKSIHKRIKQGYESGLLLNYLGDAQNNLGKYDLAYLNMKKAHEMLPANTIIADYYKSLQNKVGKSDVSLIENSISAVDLPIQIKDSIKQIIATQNNDSYEYLYSIDAYSHKIGEPNKRTTYGKIKIKNQTGIEKNKTLYFGFNQEYELAHINYLRVLDPSGNLLKELDQSTTYISTDDDGMTGDDDKLINIPVPSLSVGVEIEYAFTKVNKSPNSTQGLIEKLFVSSVTNQYKAVVLIGDIHNVTIKKSADIQQHDISKTLIYWDYKNLPNYKKTPYLPDLENIFPWIKIATTENNWNHIGTEYLKSIETKINTQFSDKELSPYFNESFTNEEIAIKLTKHAQQSISYQAIEFGDRALTPNSSRQTLVNKYGDCKDHSVLLYDLLNSAGIKAHLALINAEKEIITDLPNMGQFNHMIVYLPEIENGVFIDITDKDSTINFKNPPYHLQGHTALVLDSNQSRLIHVPNTSPKNNTIQVNRIIEDNASQILYHEKSVLKGYFAASLRGYLKSMELDEIEYRLTNWIGNYYSGLDLIKFNFSDLYDNQIPLVLEFTFAQDKKLISTKLPVFMEQYVMEFIQSPNRQWEFEYKTPFELTSETTIKKNSKLKFKKTRVNNDTNLMKWTINSNKKSINFNSTIYSHKLPAIEYRQLVKQAKRSYRVIENLLIY